MRADSAIQRNAGEPPQNPSPRSTSAPCGATARPFATMPQPRKTTRITRPDRKAAPGRRRESQPGGYAPAWDHADAAGRSYLKPPAYLSVEEVPADLLDRAYQKQNWIARFVREGCPRGELRRYAAAYAEAAGHSEVPAYTTLVEWVHRYQRWNLLGLVDRVRSDAGNSRVLEDDEKALLEIGLLGGKMNAANLTALLASCTRRDQPVSYDVVWRWLQDYVRANRGLVTLALEGQGAYRDRHRLALHHAPLAAGQRLTVDSTVADIWIKVPVLRKPGEFRLIRPVLTIVQDVGSRAIVTFNLSMYAITSAVIASLFRRVVLQEGNYPGLPSSGRPAEVVADGGAEHLGQLQRALRHLGTTVIHGPKDSPESHSHVERIIGTCTTELLQNLPGYTPRAKPLDPYEAPETDAKRSAKARMYEPDRLELPDSAFLNIEQFEARLLVWAVAYNNRGHHGLSIRSRRLRELLDRVSPAWCSALAAEHVEAARCA